MPNGPSTNLSWKELNCKDGTEYPTKFILDGRAFKLAAAFEDIRRLYNKPITVLSAYRSPTHNVKIGGARNSQHLQGRALDLKPPKGVTVDAFYDAIKRNAAEFGIGGIGKYKTFVHIDIRPTLKLAVWRGNGVKDSSNRV
jgi:uncharacterized protein YcbK (DUF882 family)